MLYFNDNSNIMFGNEDFNESFCDNCNTSLTDILSSGVVGCHNCYLVFKEEIRNILLGKLPLKSFLNKR